MLSKSRVNTLYYNGFMEHTIIGSAIIKTRIVASGGEIEIKKIKLKTLELSTDHEYYGFWKGVLHSKSIKYADIPAEIQMQLNYYG